MISIYQATSWDTIGDALRRISSLLLFARHELIEVRTTYEQLATALHLPLSGKFELLAIILLFHSVAYNIVMLSQL